MAKASVLQPGFSSGEWSPTAQGRTDSERARAALDTVSNYLPKTQGPLVRRPGTKRAADVSDPSKPPALLEFKFSQLQNYILEFGDQYVRFYTNNAQAVTNSTCFKVSGRYGTVNTPYNSSNFYAMRTSTLGNPNEVVMATSVIASGSILEIQSPYLYPDVHDLKFSQREDTIYIVHSSYPEYKLQRFGSQSWDLKTVNNLDGPYMAQNSYRYTGDSDRITIQAGAPTVIYADGSTDHQASTGPVRTVGSIVAGSSGQIKITSTAHQFYTGDRVFIRNVVGTTEANNNTSSLSAMFWNVQKISDNILELQGSVFSNGYVGSGQIFPALFQPVGAVNNFSDISRSFGLVRIDGGRTIAKVTRIGDMAHADLHVDANVSPGIGGSSSLQISEFWYLTNWSVLNGYPNAIAFHQDRKWLSGAPIMGQEVNGSVIGDYENFASSGSSFIVSDKNAIQRTLLSEQLNSVKWLRSDSQGLLAGTLSSEWNMTPSSQAGALTPSNFNAKEISTFGSFNAQPAKTGNGVLYIQNGQQRIRELNYFFQVDTYRSTDMAELADHMAGPGLKKLTVQKETIPVIWSLREDGQLRSMSYSRDDQALKAGWARHQLGGQSDSGGSAPVVRSMATIPDPTGKFDQPWFCVQRFINGTSVVSIEYLTRIFDDAVKQEDAFQMDLGGTYDSPITVSGVTTAGSAVVTAAAHGLANGDNIKINALVGLNSSTMNADGVVFNSNLVNTRSFYVGSQSVNAFFLLDTNFQPVDSRGYSAYVSGGEIRKYVSNISGITWLKNETVRVLADGGVHPDTIVNSAGVLALSFPACKVQFGYGFNSDARTMRPDVGSNDGTAIGKLGRPSRAAFLLYRVGDFKIGPNFNKLTPVELDPSPTADQAYPLFSGMIRESLESEYDFNKQVCFRQNSALPGMVQTLTLILESNDV